MKKKSISQRFFFAGLCAFAIVQICCSKKGDTPPTTPEKFSSKVITTSYGEDISDISNPERGFFSRSVSYSNTPSSLSKSYLDQQKAAHLTLVAKDYALISFRSTPISDSYLQHIQADMDLLRANGFKVLLRFAYTFNEGGPQLDAPLSIALSHIDQLTSLLQKNSDVIAVLEAGFIGQWGEWHDSSNGLANTNDMRTILFKLLDVLPKNRAVAVRYQQAKKDIFNNNSPISASEAFNQSNRSRTGAHNDCFVAAADDWGTYWPIDAVSLDAQKNYLNQENKYLPQIGETCNCNPPGSDCANSAKELERMRWSAINRDFITCVLDSWKTQGCYGDIAKRLGYRFRLIQSEIPDMIKADSALSFSFTIKNDGYASPYNPRDLELVLRSKSTGAVSKIKLNQDPRTWLPDDGNIKISNKVTLPTTITAGEYDLFLNLPDPEPTLNSNPAYSIRLANQDVWEEATGYNSLMTSINIKK